MHACGFTCVQRLYLVFLVWQQPDRGQRFQRHRASPIILVAATAEELEQWTLFGHAPVGHGSLEGYPQLLVEEARAHGAATRQVRRHISLTLEEAFDVL